jgi:hypothetical protein
MATSGKSKRPPPQRDRRLDSVPFVPRQEALGVSRAPRVVRPEGTDSPPVAGHAPAAALESDVARLKAERASDADELGAMLVRVAATERARDVAEKRASGLEKWAEELEAKVAEARTRGDELEAELVRVRREHAEALEVERARGNVEVAPSARQGAGASLPPADPSPGAIAVARDAMAQVIATLEELEKHESQSALSRARAFDLAREFLASGGTSPSRPPVTKDVPTAPSTRTPSKRSRRPPAAVRPTTPAVPGPPAAPSRPVAPPLSFAPPSAGPPTPVAPIPPDPAPPQSDSKLEMMTFEDLDLSD